MVGARLWPGFYQPVRCTGPSLPRNGSGSGKQQPAALDCSSPAVTPSLDLFTEELQCLVNQTSLQLLKRSNEHLLHWIQQTLQINLMHIV